jgi:hypothetical protein
MNRKEIEKQLSQITSDLLKDNGYISIVDVLMKMGKLSEKDYDSWRFKKISVLEKVICGNLAQINFIIRKIQENSKKGKLQSSKTVYMSWGKGSPTALRFSKSNDKNIEEAYSTHYIKPKGLKSGITNKDRLREERAAILSMVGQARPHI